MFVTWTKDSDVIGSGMTVLEDFRRYHHTLNATEEGVYNCTIANDMPDSATATFNAIRMLLTLVLYLVLLSFLYMFSTNSSFTSY